MKSGDTKANIAALDATILNYQTRRRRGLTRRQILLLLALIFAACHFVVFVSAIMLADSYEGLVMSRAILWKSVAID